MLSKCFQSCLCIFILCWKYIVFPLYILMMWEICSEWYLCTCLSLAKYIKRNYKAGFETGHTWFDSQSRHDCHGGGPLGKTLVYLPRDHEYVNCCRDITEIMLKWRKTPIKQNTKSNSISNIVGRLFFQRYLSALMQSWSQLMEDDMKHFYSKKRQFYLTMGGLSSTQGNK